MADLTLSRALHILETDPERAKALRICPISRRCGNGSACCTRTFLRCDHHAPPLYVCPIKNRGLTCPRCGQPIAERVKTGG